MTNTAIKRLYDKPQDIVLMLANHFAWGEHNYLSWDETTENQKTVALHCGSVGVECKFNIICISVTSYSF